VTLAGLTAGDENPLVPLGAAVSAAVIVYRHRTNLARLRAGTERRIGFRMNRDLGAGIRGPGSGIRGSGSVGRREESGAPEPDAGERV
jgi:hypothetical protein